MMMATTKKKKKKKKKGKKGASFDPKSLIQPAKWAGIAIIAAAILVGIAIWLRTLPGVQAFLERYPGEYELPASAPQGFPAWLNWQHFFNMFFMLLIVRSGMMIHHTPKPDSYWTRDNTKFIKTKGEPKKISMNHLIHFTFDFLWVLNGVLFFILIFATGQWMRIVPTSWDVFPNAVSAGLQYASLNWPQENGWINYNSLQQLAYFTTVFIAAPLAIVTGLRMSEAWPIKGKFNDIYRVEHAAKVHFPVMLYFVAFTAVHVFLVFASALANGYGPFHNVSHMFAAAPDKPILGFILLVVAIIVMAAAWVLVRPIFVAPIASKFGNVTTR